MQILLEITIGEIHAKEQYTGIMLRKSKNMKVEEATEVLTEQAGLTDWEIGKVKKGGIKRDGLL
ncbi:hypothetical protein [Halosimplex salinum]|uniref:hypothetical protein n=1 Tax=Halosimplex salinum TaxID=1710538 RepID=UPI0013DE4238|nr:hypothetical protein [Halosimplex salinum]